MSVKDRINPVTVLVLLAMGAIAVALIISAIALAAYLLMLAWNYLLPNHPITILEAGVLWFFLISLIKGSAVLLLRWK